MTATPAPAPDGQALEARLAAETVKHSLLSGHTDHERHVSGYSCVCGDVVVEKPGDRDYLDMHATHLATALAPVVAAEVERAVGEALESAANVVRTAAAENRYARTKADHQYAERLDHLAARVVREGGPR